jgi:hypothetical protein
MTNKKLPKIVSGFKESIVEVSKEESGRLIIRGLAVPFNKVSSNGVMYNKESLLETLAEWKRCPVMYNHMIEGDSLPIGKILDMSQKEDGLYYEVEIDKSEEKICNKIKNGYLNKVSIHILPRDVNMQSGYQEAIVGRPLEFSVVPVPGFMETDMEAYVENLKVKDKSKGDDKMVQTKKPTSSIKERQKKAIKEKISKIYKKKESLNAGLNQIKNLKEDFSKRFASKTDLKRVLSLMEEMADTEELNPDVSEDVENHENALKDAAEVLEIVINRLDRIEEMISKLSDESSDLDEETEDMEEETEEEDMEEETEEEEMTEEELDDEDDKEESMKKKAKVYAIKDNRYNTFEVYDMDDKYLGEYNSIEDIKKEYDLEEKIKNKNTKKENVNLSFVDLETSTYSTNVLHLN